jgi:hypothetical protein
MLPPIDCTIKASLTPREILLAGLDENSIACWLSSASNVAQHSFRSQS